LVFNSQTYGLDSEDLLTGNLFVRLLNISIILYLSFFEIKQIKANGIRNYMGSAWNISDTLLIMLYISYVPVSFTKPDDLYVLVAIRCGIVLFSLIKLTYYLRIFTQFSFLVQMINSVLHDLRYFMAFFGIIIFAFAVFLGILVDIDEETYDILGPIAYFVMAFRTSIGDYNLDNYSKQSNFKVIAWILWTIVMIIGNVIFMNFIIAVVNQSYENCMSKMTA
jgi:hypothetical protein